MDSNEEIVQRLDDRPGFNIVNYREVGIPVFQLSTLLTLQDNINIGVIEEFILKSINQSVNTSNSIIDFLGLPEQVVHKQLAALLYENLITNNGEQKNIFRLTLKGEGRLKDIVSVSVSQEIVPINIDGITRDILSIESNLLYTSKQLEAIGVMPILPSPRRPPASSEIDISNINRMFNTFSFDNKAKRKALRIDGILGRSHISFRLCLAIAFKSDNGRKISVAFALDGRLSDEHENLFMGNKLTEKSKAFNIILNSNLRRKEIQQVRQHIRKVIPSVDQKIESKAIDKKRNILSLNKSNNNSRQPTLVKPLQVYEHPPLLVKAFLTAKKRILIISPWLRAKVINNLFIKQLLVCLNNNIQVSIYYGLGTKDKDERPFDKQAREELEMLSLKYTNFELVRKGNTHAKVLLVDNSFFVTTSFNWLSFKGNPNQPFREEWGTYVEGTDLVEDYYNKLKVS